MKINVLKKSNTKSKHLLSLVRPTPDGLEKLSNRESPKSTHMCEKSQGNFNNLYSCQRKSVLILIGSKLRLCISPNRPIQFYSLLNTLSVSLSLSNFLFLPTRVHQCTYTCTFIVLQSQP